MSVLSLKAKFDSLLTGLKSVSTVRFSKTVESAYEALVLADLMQEYARIKSGVKNINSPAAGYFLNQAPGKFRKEQSFFIEFNNGEAYYFAADVEVFGLVARERSAPTGMLFEADAVVIKSELADEVITDYDGYPAPQHIDCLIECKFGRYYKGQLRELLGLRRHVSLLGRKIAHAPVTGALYGIGLQRAVPPIALFMARPIAATFVDINTAELYDLGQIRIS
ncbi:hypothetical protein SAMN05428975_3982 [Mucilaginibacter sp. OK268]|uniref:hypothetical protein n=1 Tax=Mucilaginibacter sp. OK268 TaxID=1881048 RepID=UPI000883C3B4|nr:hypothetical protein [Mucilaginibacter sp. OK268]SDP94720.1 hypothetical protein SAMN05428975_3982 [Mucilaginibacter sp. OK268]